MNRVETLKILAVLKAEYPRTYDGKNAKDLEAVVSLWMMAFADDEYQIVSAAVMQYIVTDNKTFREPPGVGMIKAAIQKITNPDQITEQEAWAEVAKVLKDCSNSPASVRYATNNPERKTSAQRHFDELPPLIRQVVGSPNQLAEWALMDSEVLQSVVASNFMRSYRVRAESSREYMALPSAMRDTLDQLTEKMKFTQLDGGSEDG